MPAQPLAQKSKQPRPPLSKSMEEVLNVRSAVTERRTRVARWIDGAGHLLSRPWFIFVLFLAHIVWVVLNLPLFPWEPWDPYPFVFLATWASAEAPFIALLVLMHQQRNARIDELRDEVNLQVSLQVEREVALALRLLRELQESQGVQTAEDSDLIESLREDLDARELMEHVRAHLENIEGGEGDISP